MWRHNALGGVANQVRRMTINEQQPVFHTTPLEKIPKDVLDPTLWACFGRTQPAGRVFLSPARLPTAQHSAGGQERSHKRRSSYDTRQRPICIAK